MQGTPSTSALNNVVCLSRAELRQQRGPLLHVDERVPAVVSARGNADLLRRRLLALFGSIKFPAEIGTLAAEVCQSFAQNDIGIIGPFHSALEQKCLEILLHGTGPIIICPGRAVQEVQLRPEWRGPFDEGRLLLLSHLEFNVKRINVRAAQIRNRFVAAMADDVLTAYAHPGGKIEALCRDIITWPKPLYTIDSACNSVLIAAGARPILPFTAAQQLAVLRLAG